MLISLKHTFFLFIFILIHQLNGMQEILAQDKMRLSIGAGVGDMINIGLRARVNQAQIGASIGSYFQGQENKSISFTFVPISISLANQNIPIFSPGILETE